MAVADSSGLHRVRRLRWQARAQSAADAFALQQLLRRRSDDVGHALEQTLASASLSGEVWHLSELTLSLDAGSLAQMDADLPALVAGSLRQALQAARNTDAAPRCADVIPSTTPVNDHPLVMTSTTTAESAEAALRHYLATGNLPWALAGLSVESQQQTLRDAAQVALEALLTTGNNPLTLSTLMYNPSAPLPTRIGMLLRWLPLLSLAQRQRWLARSPRPAGVAPILADAWLALLTSPGTPLEWLALWVGWPARQGLPHNASASDATALARWIADLPADIAALRLPQPIARDIYLASALRQALGDTPARSSPPASPPASPSAAQPEVRDVAKAIDTATESAVDSQLVPLAGLVLLHPYLPRFLKGCGLQTIDHAALPRACALLHALACGSAAAAEYQLPLIKLLLGRAPDEPLTAALPHLNATDWDEINSLLAAVRSHWTALGHTSADGLRLSFLQRRGLLRKAEGAWQLHMQAEGFDVLLSLLPWAISLVKLPWMPLPLIVEWHAP
jgi:Contractile injection system tape measure protein